MGPLIRIQEDKNDPQTTKIEKKLIKISCLDVYVLVTAGCSLLRAEDFCSLDVLYEGLGISKLLFLIKIRFF
jgi:hypothetical protein